MTETIQQPQALIYISLPGEELRDANSPLKEWTALLCHLSSLIPAALHSLRALLVLNQRGCLAQKYFISQPQPQTFSGHCFLLRSANRP